MLFMVIERFKHGNPRLIGERFQRKGRMLPEGVAYHASWVDPAGARCFQVMEAPHAEPITVAGCKGTRIQGSGQAKDSSTVTRHVVYAASDGTVLYLFSLRSPVEKFEQSAEVFEKAMTTAKLAAAK